MTDDAAHSSDILPVRGALSILSRDDGLVVTGDDALVQGYTDNLRQLARQGVDVVGVSKKQAARVAAMGAGLADFGAHRSVYVKLSSSSVQLLRKYSVIPGTNGYNRMTVVDANKRFAGQLQWKQVSLGPANVRAMHMLAMQMALMTAISSVEDAVARVQDTVEELLRLAKADRVGDILGRHEVVKRMAFEVEERGAVPETDWQTVASLGPDIEIAIEKLRAYIKDSLDGLGVDAPIQDRAEYLHKVADSNRIGDTLRLLVIAEDTLYQWQRVRIARVADSEPHHLDSVVASARATLRDHARFDSELIGQARQNLQHFAKVRPLEIIRFLSGNRMESDAKLLNADIDAFAQARGLQIAEWVHAERPKIGDAVAEISDRAGSAARNAKDAGSRAVDVGAAGLSRAGGWLQKPAAAREASRQPRDGADDGSN